MGNVIRNISDRTNRKIILKKRNILEPVARRFLTFMEAIQSENYFKPRKTRPHRRPIKYSNAQILKTSPSNIVWNEDNPDDRVHKEFDPTVPDERFDKFELEALVNLAEELLTKKSKNYTAVDYDAAIAMMRYLNAEKLAFWGCMVRDAVTAGDGSTTGAD